jgi:hypothetical protein
VLALSGDTTAADNSEAFFDGTGYAGTNNVIPTVTTVNGLAANTVTASAVAADAVTEIQSGLATAAALTTVDDFLDTEIADIQARLPAALVGGRIDANVGAISTDATAADNAEAFFDGTGYAGTNNVIPTVTTVTTLTGHTPQTGDSFAIVNSGTHGNAAIKGFVDDIGAAGAGLSAVPWNAAWDAEVQSEVQDALDSTVADSVPADGSRPSISQALLMLTRFMWEKGVSGTTVTVKKEDGSTTSMTFTLDSATDPTSITRAS